MSAPGTPFPSAAQSVPVVGESGKSTPETGFSRRLFEAQPFSGYELQECLEAEGRSAVFKARDAAMERTVAVKALSPSARRESAVEEFFAEAGSVARVRAQGVLRGFDAGRGGGAFFMAHELARGDSLDDRLSRRQTGKFTEREAFDIVRRLAGALELLFAAGQRHGDLRPKRIILLPGGELRLAGIGFAWQTAFADDDGAHLAKPEYLSPERIRGDENYDIRADLYALGCLWWRMLLGEPPFRGSTPGETLRMHLETDPASPRELDPRLSAATSQLMLALLAKDRDARPRTPRDFLKRLAGHPLSENGEGERQAAGTGEKVDGENDPDLLD
jgi:serine/threonine-protein kinase